MSNNSNFFESPQAAAIYKHKLIKSYIPVWAGKVGSTSQGKRVVVYDAYSGPGRYEDENPGSPELLVDTAVAMAALRSVRTVFSEQKKEYCDRLLALLEAKSELDPNNISVRVGPVEDHVDAVLRESGDLPLFVFLDPFGLTISFDRVVQVLASRDKPGLSRLLQPKTELLMNFSYEAVRRIGGVVRSDKIYAARDGQIESLDRALGGDWWQDLARDEPDGWVEQILNGYAQRVGNATGCSWVTAEVADSLDAQPVYELILFTRHPDGLWEAISAMSKARKEWRSWLVDRKEEAARGQVEIPGLDFADNEDAWIAELAHNIRSLLDEVGRFTISSYLERVFGKTLGLARETHLRKALRQLKADGVIPVVPTGSLQRAQIARS